LSSGVNLRLALLALTSVLAAQDFTQSPIEEIATGFTGGEGPVWSRDGYLLFSDYDANRIYKYVPGKSPEVYREGPTAIQWIGKDACTHANIAPGESPAPAATDGLK
jgi:sugar lactone lactonase YvrE